MQATTVEATLMKLTVDVDHLLATIQLIIQARTAAPSTHGTVHPSCNLL